jgi:hypothetical protein
VAHRRFSDGHGRAWEVWEVHPTMTERRSARQTTPLLFERRRHGASRPSLPGGLASGWLAFESKSERRRLSPIPEDWANGSDAQLADLLERATSRSKTRRLIE